MVNVQAAKCVHPVYNNLSKPPVMGEFMSQVAAK